MKGAYSYLAGYIPALGFIAALSPRITYGLARAPLASNLDDGALAHPGVPGGFYDSFNGDAVTVQLAGLRVRPPVVGDITIATELGG